MPITYTQDGKGISPLPVCADQYASETMPEYAARVLRFVLETGITATLSDEQLAQADTAAQRAVCQLPAQLSPTDATIQARLSDIRHRIARTLAYRTAQEAQDARQDATAPQGGKNPGRPAPLVPQPYLQPPGGQYADSRPNLQPARADGIRF